MIVVGIDPGSHATGYGIVERFPESDEWALIEFGVIRPSDKSHAGRLIDIHDQILQVIDRVKPDVCAIEMPVYGQNPQSMLKLGRAQAAAMLAVLRRQIPVVEYTPKQVKKSVTGNGSASKRQVCFMIRQLLTITEDLALDAADALAVGVCHAHRIEQGRLAGRDRRASSWEAFARDNPDRIVE